MTLPTDPLDLSVLLYHEIQQRQIVDGRNLAGVLPSTLNFSSVKRALEDADLLISESEIDRRIEFTPHQNFYISLDALLSGVGRRITPPRVFFIANLNFRYPPSAQNALPINIQAYLDATALYECLSSAADHITRMGSAQHLIFLSNKKLEIAPNYTTEDLALLPKIDDFKAQFIDTESHKLQKTSIIKTVLIEQFPGQQSISFSTLIASFEKFYENLRTSYQLYVSEFSFQKVKAEIEKEKFEFTAKLNKVFSDIQSQILAVPAALVLIGGQMEDSSKWTLKNFLIWIGALVFSIFMNLLIGNQRQTLESIKNEIDQQWELIKGKHKAVAEQFESSYRQLDIRYTHQKTLLMTVEYIVATALIASTAMLILYSEPSHFISSLLAVGSFLVAAGCRKLFKKLFS